MDFWLDCFILYGQMYVVYHQKLNVFYLGKSTRQRGS